MKENIHVFTEEEKSELHRAAHNLGKKPGGIFFHSVGYAIDTTRSIVFLVPDPSLTDVNAPVFDPFPLEKDAMSQLDIDDPYAVIRGLSHADSFKGPSYFITMGGTHKPLSLPDGPTTQSVTEAISVCNKHGYTKCSFFPPPRDAVGEDHDNFTIRCDEKLLRQRIGEVIGVSEAAKPGRNPYGNGK